jgi:hypothetical protein
MKYYTYKVEKIDDYKNTATSLSHDYAKDFEEYRNLRGYVKIDYYTTDTPDMVDGKVYCCGTFLVKAVELVSTFENEPIRLKFNFEE